MKPIRVAALFVISFSLMTSRVLRAQEAPEHPTPATAHATEPGGSHHVGASAAGEAPQQPTLPAEARTWAGPMLIIIAGMFLAAAVIGPIVRSEADDEPPADDAHGHDAHGHDPHADHGHGHGH